MFFGVSVGQMAVYAQTKQVNSALRADKPSLIWSAQFGSSANERATDLALDDSANVYAVGYTEGDFAQKNAGMKDGFLVKYTATGKLAWTYQIGTTQDDWIWAVTVGHDDHLYLAGIAGGVLGDHRYLGRNDCFVAKLNQSREMVWINQFGSSGEEWPLRIVLDSEGNIYVCGYTDGRMGAQHYGGNDAFVAKFNNEGAKLWAKQFGTNQLDQCWSFDVDGKGDVFMAVCTGGDLGGGNAGNIDNCLIHLNEDGDLLNRFQYGTSHEDTCLGIAVEDEGNRYVGGTCNNKASLTALDKTGTILWEHQFGFGQWSGTWGVDIFQDGSEDILVGGCQDYGRCKPFLSKYADNGTLIWNMSLYKDQNKNTCGRRIAIDKKGACYQTGFSDDDLFGERIGGYDGFLYKIGTSSTVAEPNGPIHNLGSGERFGSIKLALTFAHAGDTLVIDPGLYSESLVVDKDIVIRSVDPNDPTYIGSTIIQGNAEEPVLSLSNTSRACTLSGLILRAGSVGIRGTGTQATISNCRIMGNVTHGLELSQLSNPLLENCLITANGQTGITMHATKLRRDFLPCEPILKNCTIVGNGEAAFAGGAPVIVDSVIQD